MLPGTQDRRTDVIIQCVFILFRVTFGLITIDLSRWSSYSSSQRCCECVLENVASAFSLSKRRMLMFFIVAGWRLAIPHGISVRWSIYIDLHTHGLHYIYAIHDICRSTESSRVLNVVVDLSPSHPLHFPSPSFFHYLPLTLFFSISLTHTHTHTNTYTHTHIHMHTHTHTPHTHTHTHTHAYTHTHTYTHAYAHTRIHTHTHTHTHTHLYTYLQKHLPNASVMRTSAFVIRSIKRDATQQWLFIKVLYKNSC